MFLLCLRWFSTVRIMFFRAFGFSFAVIILLFVAGVYLRRWAFCFFILLFAFYLLLVWALWRLCGLLFLLGGLSRLFTPSVLLRCLLYFCFLNRLHCKDHIIELFKLADHFLRGEGRVGKGVDIRLYSHIAGDAGAGCGDLQVGDAVA